MCFSNRYLLQTDCKSINAAVLFSVAPLTKEKPRKGFITDNLGPTTISSSRDSIVS